MRQYYLDLERKWRIETSQEGISLLSNLDNTLNRSISKPSSSLVQQGLKLYRNKGRKITWKDDVYKHKGFQWVYINVKSRQRFCETYNLISRLPLDKNSKVISVGGGPGIELLAFKALGYNNVHNFEYNNAWKESSEALGLPFTQYSFFGDQGELLSLSPDIIYMSYVYSNYLDNEVGVKLIHQYLSVAKYVIINDRRRLVSLEDILPLCAYRVLSYNCDYQIVITKDPIIGLDVYKTPLFHNIPYVRNLPVYSTVYHGEDTSEKEERNIKTVVKDIPEGVLVIDAVENKVLYDPVKHNKILLCNVNYLNTDNQYKWARLRGISLKQLNEWNKWANDNLTS